MDTTLWVRRTGTFIYDLRAMPWQAGSFQKGQLVTCGGSCLNSRALGTLAGEGSARACAPPWPAGP